MNCELILLLLYIKIRYFSYLQLHLDTNLNTNTHSNYIIKNMIFAYCGISSKSWGNTIVARRDDCLPPSPTPLVRFWDDGRTEGSQTAEHFLCTRLWWYEILRLRGVVNQRQRQNCIERRHRCYTASRTYLACTRRTDNCYVRSMAGQPSAGR